MGTRPLGRTGLSIFPLGLGTVKLGRNTDVKYPEPFELPDEAQVSDLLEGALDLGIDLYDTAPAYGSSEVRLGSFVRHHRERVVVCTKAGEQYDERGSRFDFSAGALVASAEASLRRLGIDTLDLLLLHSNGEDLRILRDTDALEGLAKLKREGKARAVGISAKTAAGIEAACEDLDVVMAPFSASDPSRGSALERAHRRGLGVLAIKALASGTIAKDPESDAVAATPEDGAGAASPEATRPAASPSDVDEALAYVLRQPFVDGMVLGTLRLAHLRQAVGVVTRLARDS